MDSCIVCWEINEDTTCRILTTSNEWPAMQKIIEKHLNWWNLRKTPDLNNVQWICQYCWQEISAFHTYYVRVENVQKQFPMSGDFKNGPKSMAIKGLTEFVPLVNIKNEIISSDNKYANILIVDPITQKAAIDDDDEKEFLEIPREELTPALKDIIEHDELNIVDIKNEATLSETNDFDELLERMEHEDIEKHDQEENFKLPLKRYSEDGKHFHNSIKSYLEYDEKCHRIKDLNRANIDFINDNFSFNCDICNDPLGDYRSLKDHYQTKHNTPGYVMCCDKKLLKQMHLVDHIHYHKNPDYFKCPKCGKSYATRVYFRKHLREHKTKKKPVRESQTCDICGLKVTSKGNLKTHINRMHLEENLKEHICSICSRVSASLAIHKEHIRNAHAMERKHKCHYCTKAFKMLKHMREHESTHTGIALYSCSFCSETFIRSGEMYKHRKSMHPKEWKEEQLKTPKQLRQSERGKKKILKLDLNKD